MQLKLNGNEVFYANGGVVFEAAKPTVVFLHGAGMDHTVWTLYSRYFARGTATTFSPLTYPGMAALGARRWPRSKRSRSR